ncbi:tyrosine-type recombinase/integrase [Planococcus sp. YIM B11945]|uniref:tyrosine-type recombinase/integrase n=1 Tax=Planococcus sp. YIM B11945 TaxID=3435410 RepID=UPI003D7F1212
MASFQKYTTKSGERWLFKMDIGKDPATGDRKSTTRRGFKRKSDAEKAAAKLLRELMTGEEKKEDITFEEVFNEWYEKHKRKIKPSTRYTKESKFRKHILPHFAKLKMKDITRAYCQKYVNDLADHMTSYKDYVIQANLVFKYAMRNDYLFKNPMGQIEYPMEEEQFLADNEKEMKFWEKDVFQKVISKGEQELPFRDYLMIRLFLVSGLRKGELSGLLETSLIEETNSVRVARTVFWRSKEFFLMTPKTKNSLRDVEVDEQTFKLLKQLVKMNKELRMVNGNPKVDKFLFPRQDLKPLRSAYPNDVLARLCKRIGVEDIGVHGLRHTHASMLFASGASMKDVQERLGHARLDTTMNLYTHITKERKQETTKKFVDYMTL